MKLPSDVAYEVAYMLKHIVVRPEFERDPYCLEIAEKLVRTRALADTIAWMNYISNQWVD